MSEWTADLLAYGLVNLVPEATIIVDAGVIKLANPQAEKLFGYPSGELVGLTLEMLLPERARHRHVVHRSRYLRHPLPRPMGAGFEMAAKRRDGSEFAAEVLLRTIKTEAGVVVSATIRSVAEHRAMQQHIREQNEHYIRMAEKSERALHAVLERRFATAERQRRAGHKRAEFLSTMSHELRTPLTSIYGYLELLTDSDEQFSAQALAMLDTMTRNTQRLIHVVDDLLQLTELEIAEVPQGVKRAQSVDLCALVNDAARALQPYVERQGQNLTTSMPSEPLTVLGNPQQLSCAVATIVMNASDYTPSGGDLSIDVSGSSDYVTVTINDPSVTVPVLNDPIVQIPVVEQDKLFEWFVRKAGSNNYVGPGLGLLIVKSIVSQHGGYLEVQSHADTGTSFAVSFPAALPEPRAGTDDATTQGPA